MAIKNNHREISVAQLLHNFGIGKPQKVSTMWRVNSIHLGGRINNITYTPAGFNFIMPYFIDMVEGTTGDTSLQLGVCTKISELVPEGSNKPVVCTDYLNPFQIPVKIYLDSGKWHLSPDENSKKTFLYEDGRYLAIIDDTRLQVFIHIYKK